MTVKELIDSITDEEIKQYNQYWDILKPTTDEQFQNCLVFAFLSIRTTWRMNVAGFNTWGNGKIISIVQAVNNTPDSDPTKPAKVAALNAMIEALQTGLQLRKITSVKSFVALLEEDKEFFKKKETETWRKYRDRLAASIDWLGITKASFAIELMYPDTSEVICLDSRMMKLLGLKGLHASSSKYKKIEAEWLAACKEKGVAPAIARHIVWSRESPSGNCTDWADCLDSSGTASAIFNN